MFRKLIIAKIILLGLILVIALSQAFSRVIEEKGKTYIVDWHGERWDVTQAASIGFEPHLMSSAMNIDPAVRVGFVLTDLAANIRMKDFSTATGKAT